MVTLTHVNESELPITLVHIEDEEDWFEEIRNDVEQKANMHFHQYLRVSTIEHAIRILPKVKNPILLLVDLGLPKRDTKSLTLSGLDWLINEYQESQNHVSYVSTFVISAQLSKVSAQRINELCGVPVGHIFDKGYWEKNYSVFLSNLTKVTSKYLENKQTEEFGNPALNVSYGIKGFNDYFSRIKLKTDKIYEFYLNIAFHDNIEIDVLRDMNELGIVFFLDTATAEVTNTDTITFFPNKKDNASHHFHFIYDSAKIRELDIYLRVFFKGNLIRKYVIPVEIEPD